MMLEAKVRKEGGCHTGREVKAEEGKGEGREGIKNKGAKCKERDVKGRR